VPEPDPLQQIDRTYVSCRGRKLSYFSGCDYFRLSSHPLIHQAAVQGLRKSGLSVSASRATSGNHRIYLDLEKHLARFFQADTATLVSTGYLANSAVAQALIGHFSHALIDEAAHPALRDAVARLECPVLNFRHHSPDDVQTIVTRLGQGTRLILLTDGMFSRDGTVAPLAAYRSILPRDAVMLVDDAHGAGVLGINGRGSPEQEGISRRNLIQTITLSKAFGTYGGAVLGSRALRKRILSRSNIFVGSTPLPLPLACAAEQSLRLLHADPTLQKRLRDNTRHIRNALLQAGLPVIDAPGPIIAFRPRDKNAARLIKNRLLKAAIYPAFLIYPGGPLAGYFRFVISSEHTLKQLDNLARALIALANVLEPM
jgi:8-amino-7-oxononanoate synthase